jgi:hypothetical protein
MRVKSWIRIRIKVKIPEISTLKMEPWRAIELSTMEAWRLKSGKCAGPWIRISG